MDDLLVTEGWLTRLVQPLALRSTKRSIYDTAPLSHLHPGPGAEGVRHMHFDSLDVTVLPCLSGDWEVIVEWVGFPKEEYLFRTQEEFQNWFGYLFQAWELKVRPTSTMAWEPVPSPQSSTRTRQWGDRIKYSAIGHRSPLSVEIYKCPNAGWTICLDNVPLKSFGENLDDAKRYVEAWFSVHLIWKLSPDGNTLINHWDELFRKAGIARQDDGLWETDPPVEDPLRAIRIWESCDARMSGYFTSAPAVMKTRKPRGSVAGTAIY